MPNFRSVSLLVWPGGVTQLHTYTNIRVNLRISSAAARLTWILINYNFIKLVCATYHKLNPSICMEFSRNYARMVGMIPFSLFQSRVKIMNIYGTHVLNDLTLVVHVGL